MPKKHHHPNVTPPKPEFRGTPGPWHPVLFGYHWSILTGPSYTDADVFRERLPDDTADTLDRGVDPDKARRNAALAAAAPELFAALLRCLLFRVHDRETKQVILAALRKAAPDEKLT